MAMTGVLRPGYIQIRVLDMDAAVTHYVDRIGLNMVSRGNDGRVYLKGWDEFDRHSIILRPADTPGMARRRSPRAATPWRYRWQLLSGARSGSGAAGNKRAACGERC